VTALKKIAGLLLALHLFFLYASSQKNDIIINHPDRYRLRLPEEWMYPKVIKAVTDILPKTIDELKGRDFCTVGKAAYYIFLIIDTFSIDQSGYSFHAALRTYDSLGRVIADLLLFSPKEIFSLRRSIKIRPADYYSTATYVYSPAPDETNSPPLPVWDEDFFTFSSLKLNILNMCKKKIFEIKKLLRRFNQE
jgi:hypothetical protein